jgi:hypothetical protein
MVQSQKNQKEAIADLKRKDNYFLRRYKGDGQEMQYLNQFRLKVLQTAKITAKEIECG